MFGRTDKAMDEAENTENQDAPQTALTGGPVAQAPRTMGPTASPRRQMEMGRAATSRRVPSPEPRSPMGSDLRKKLTVGEGLSLSGEISACDVLVVEGKVEAKLSDGKLLEITETGQFRGSVEIENADIAGRYDGDLTVHGRLTIRGTGRISGVVKYGELEVNAGGQIIGEMQVVGGGAGASGSNFKSAAKFAASSQESDDEGDEGALFSRKTAVNG